MCYIPSSNILTFLLVAAKMLALQMEQWEGPNHELLAQKGLSKIFTQKALQAKEHKKKSNFDMT